ncbi:glycerophosphodiester phosphodiesterase [Nocardioides sp.]|uniref:glycerophosphodiester phosphodiesterase n=1 Tax=Nocardioides sp. TaxID=35761 RepID=UPI002B8A1ECE|nr:glycerophosphodiester phosphodiesterase [Nocardioides sp.]HXH81183.1 glycerophosphodiester phosphodiesterase [Nocardioides sp.]
MTRVYLDHPGVLAFAHRGGAFHPELEGLENTMAAFRHAVDLGYVYLETDVHVTSDGMLLAFHDEVLDRVTDRTGSISSTSYADVQAALIGGRERVPTLTQLFEEFPKARFNIDIKSEGSVPALADFISVHDAWDRVLVGSFSARRLSTFRRLTEGRVATSAHPFEVAAYVLSPTARLARMLTPGRPDALQIPHRQGRLTVASPGVIRRAHANGLQVHVWTIDDPAEMSVLLDRGVDGLVTDRTDILSDVLRSRGQWEGPS